MLGLIGEHLAASPYAVWTNQLYTH